MTLRVALALEEDLPRIAVFEVESGLISGTHSTRNALLGRKAFENGAQSKVLEPDLCRLRDESLEQLQAPCKPHNLRSIPA